MCACPVAFLLCQGRLGGVAAQGTTGQHDLRNCKISERGPADGGGGVGVWSPGAAAQVAQVLMTETDART